MAKLSQSVMPSARKLYHNYKARARKSGRDFDLTFEDFVRLTSQSCKFCGAHSTGSITRKGYEAYKHVGLDRIDSRGGYTLSNVQPCCGICNRMKWNNTDEDFTHHIKRISDMDSKQDWPIVEVIWVDAYSTDEWSDLSGHSDGDPYRVRSIGYLLKVDEYQHTLIKSISLDGSAGCMSLKIPNGMIESVTYLDFTKSDV